MRIIELNSHKHCAVQNAVTSWYQLLAFAPVLGAIIYQPFNISLVVGISLFETELLVNEDRQNCSFNCTMQLSWVRVSHCTELQPHPPPHSPRSK